MTPWTVAHQAPLSMEFSKQEYWSGLPIPFPGDFPNQGNELRSPTLQADSLPSDMQAFKFYTERAVNLEVNSFPNFFCLYSIVIIVFVRITKVVQELVGLSIKIRVIKLQDVIGRKDRFQAGG